MIFGNDRKTNERAIVSYLVGCFGLYNQQILNLNLLNTCLQGEYLVVNKIYSFHKTLTVLETFVTNPLQ